MLFYGDYEGANLLFAGLLAATLLWQALRPKRRPAPAWPDSRRWVFLAIALFVLAGAIVSVASGRYLLPFTLAAAALYAGALAWFLSSLHAEAAAVRHRGWPARWRAAAGLPLGHFSILAATVPTLGFRGESALAHAFVLIGAVLALCAGLGLAALAAAAVRRPPR